jgi:hypothetical protein
MGACKDWMRLNMIPRKGLYRMRWCMDAMGNDIAEKMPGAFVFTDGDSKLLVAVGSPCDARTWGTQDSLHRWRGGRGNSPRSFEMEISWKGRHVRHRRNCMSNLPAAVTWMECGGLRRQKVRPSRNLSSVIWLPKGHEEPPKRLRNPPKHQLSHKACGARWVSGIFFFEQYYDSMIPDSKFITRMHCPFCATGRAPSSTWSSWTYATQSRQAQALHYISKNFIRP